MRINKAYCLSIFVITQSLFYLGCKVPLSDINARFELADSSWFEEEETLFFFYKVKADQGLGKDSIIEITYTTDHIIVPWTNISTLSMVHKHEAVDCVPDHASGVTDELFSPNFDTGPSRSMCGSLSLHVSIEPRFVDIRMRYHREGELSLNTATNFNVIATGAAHSHRSVIVYGVFDKDNQTIQWRGRHQFPTIRNMQAEKFGLRREFTISAQRFSPDNDKERLSEDNPYLYGEPCPAPFAEAAAGGFRSLDFTDETNLPLLTRAIFNSTALPLMASSSASVCAIATTTDALGDFTRDAWARKNPQVKPAFPALKSPIKNATPLRLFLGPCNSTISLSYLEMQRQRLLFTHEPTYCTDNWRSINFIPDLVIALRDLIETNRPLQNDMVIVIALHRQNNDGLAEAIESALSAVVLPERTRSTPRVVGAFVLDSESRKMASAELRRVTLWCPSVILPVGENLLGEQTREFDKSMETCAILPDNTDLELGPFSFSELPILPGRERYLDFVDTYSESQTGYVTSLHFRAPEFTPTTDNVDLGGLVVATFMNNEIISAATKDSFSYCASAASRSFAFRSAGTALLEDTSVLPLEYLPDWHNDIKETTYELGVVWDFPYLLQMEYRAIAAGSVSALSLSVPFGIARDATNDYGGDLWSASTYALKDQLLQCTRFCNHPTFDSAKVYNVTLGFRSTYGNKCYLPDFPKLSDSGSPYDP